MKFSFVASRLIDIAKLSVSKIILKERFGESWHIVFGDFLMMGEKLGEGILWDGLVFGDSNIFAKRKQGHSAEDHPPRKIISSSRDVYHIAPRKNNPDREKIIDVFEFLLSMREFLNFIKQKGRISV